MFIVELALNKSLSMVIPKCAELVKTDEEISVVIGVLDSLNEIVKDIKKPAVEGSHRVAIVNSIRDVLTYKVIIFNFNLKQFFLKKK